MNISIGDYSTFLSWWTISTLVLAILLAFLVLYIRFLLAEITRLAEFFVNINNEIFSFSSHLKSIYDLQIFYGDETLEGLLKHSYHLVDKFEQFGEVFGLEEDEESEEEKDSDTNGGDVDEERKQERPETIPFQPQLFYGGTREGDS